MASAQIGLKNFTAAVPFLNDIIQCNGNTSAQDTAYQQLSFIYEETNQIDLNNQLVVSYAEYTQSSVHQANSSLACSYATNLLEHSLFEKAHQYLLLRLGSERSDSKQYMHSDTCMLEAYHRVLMVQQEYQQAAAISRRIIQLTASCTDENNQGDTAHSNTGHRLLGESLLALNDVESALAELTLSNTLNSSDVDTLFLIAYAYELRLDYTHSETLYSQAVTALGEDVQLSVLLDLGKLQQKVGLYEKALSTLLRCEALCSEAYSLVVDCGEIHLQLGECA